MTSARATEVAEILWELKRAGKVATYTTIARRAGFNPGSKCQTIENCLNAVRRDWPHLQWWRAVGDDMAVAEDSEQGKFLLQAGYELDDSARKGRVSIKAAEDHIMVWAEQAGLDLVK
ncbi:MAG: hypothetical protein O2955_09630 [Planctomycetota bacterium]|nr:hypothetical protein [Planctomycetota bacterium]MDA1212769.1 hypothetical protein [Planctomycetota bacterium]